MTVIHLEDIVYPGIVTTAAGIQLGIFAGKVYNARTKYKIEFPAVTGNTNFERVFRAQQNTLEWFPVFATALWGSSLFFHQVPSALCGVVYLYSRHKYFKDYSASVEARVPGFILGVKCMQIMLVMSAAGFVTVLLRRHAGIDLAVIFRSVVNKYTGILL